MATKKTRGRLKIDLAKIKNERNLHVTFSKRRAGLFKKASELCTLTGSEVALVVFSPGQKAYSFGSPSVNAIIERFESQTPHPTSLDPSNLLVEAHHKANVQHLNKELTILENQFECEEKRGESLNRIRKVGQSCNWWQTPINELNVEQLEHLKLAFLVLHKIVKAEMQKLMSKNASKNSIHQVIHPYGIGCFGVNNARKNVPSVYDLFRAKAFGVMALPPCAGMSSASISIMNVGKNVPTTLVPYDPKETGSDVGGPMPPNHEGFNHGFGGIGLF
ncbi:hypothetical protein ACH5RR_028884 [Cinchona calisaya]|uniref:MADS-box domain-containing protein n=1 Tax=Cinchona calisaya TaxID=153742 RepID=A0ABD2YRA8_9GENT